MLERNIRILLWLYDRFRCTECTGYTGCTECAGYTGCTECTGYTGCTSCTGYILTVWYDMTDTSMSFCNHTVDTVDRIFVNFPVRNKYLDMNKPRHGRRLVTNPKSINVNRRFFNLQQTEKRSLKKKEMTNDLYVDFSAPQIRSYIYCLFMYELTFLISIVELNTGALQICVLLLLLLCVNIFVSVLDDWSDMKSNKHWLFIYRNW